MNLINTFSLLRNVLFNYKTQKTIYALKGSISKNSLRTSCAVSRFLGSRTSIPLTRSFASSEILGQGSDEKSRSPCSTCSNISCSVSTHSNHPKLHLKIKYHWEKLQVAIDNNTKAKSWNSHHPRKEALHLVECKQSLRHSKHLLLDHNVSVGLQVQHSMGFQPHL